MTFEEWYPYKHRIEKHGEYSAYETLIHHREYEAAKAAWHAGQEVMKEKAAQACEGCSDLPPNIVEGPDSWDWHSKDYAAVVRAQTVE